MHELEVLQYWFFFDKPAGGAIIIFHVDADKSIDKILHGCMILICFNNSGMLYPSSFGGAIAHDDGGGSAIAMVDELAEIIRVLFFNILVNVEIVVVVVVESLTLRYIFAVVAEAREHSVL